MNDVDDLPEDRQSVRNAWTNALRSAVLRIGTADMAKVAAVGVWLATYANPDGSQAFPSRETLAALAGCSTESVTRAIRVLVGVGVLAKRRRPNSNAVYQLLMPIGALDWTPHLAAYAQTRQKRAHARKKAADAAATEARMASVDAVRTASTVTGPDSVHAKGSEPAEQAPDSVHGRPRTASTDAFRTASMDAPTSTYLPTVGTPTHDPTRFGPRPQPPVARASPAAPLPAGRRDPAPPGAAVQPPLLLSVPTSPPPATPQDDRCPACRGHLASRRHAHCPGLAAPDTANTA